MYISENVSLAVFAQHVTLSLYFIPSDLENGFLLYDVVLVRIITTLSISLYIYIYNKKKIGLRSYEDYSPFCHAAN